MQKNTFRWLIGLLICGGGIAVLGALLYSEYIKINWWMHLRQFPSSADESPVFVEIDWNMRDSWKEYLEFQYGGNFGVLNPRGTKQRVGIFGLDRVIQGNRYHGFYVGEDLDRINSDRYLVAFHARYLPDKGGHIEAYLDNTLPVDIKITNFNHGKAVDTDSGTTYQGFPIKVSPGKYHLDIFCEE